MKIVATILLLFTASVNAQTTFALLNGGGSINATTYEWRQISGANSILQTPSLPQCRVDSLSIGVRLFELTCTNDFGESRDSVMITVIQNGATITSAVFTPTSLTWTVTGEKNVLYYWLQKTRDGNTTQVTKYYARGGIKYTYYMKATIFQYEYTITPVFKDGSTGGTVVFN